MPSEDKAYAKINRILSKLEPDVAAGVARRLTDSYGGTEPEQRPDADRSAPIAKERSGGSDGRPSFLQTQLRMEEGRRLVDELTKRSSSGRD